MLREIWSTQDLRTGGAAKWQPNTNHRCVCTNAATGGKRKEHRETKCLFTQEYELDCEVSYRGPCCTEAWQLVKLGTEQSHTSQPVGETSLCPDLTAALWYLLNHFLAMPSSSARGPAVVRALSSPSWPICFISLALWDEGRRLHLKLRSSQYFATGNWACCNTALSQQLIQWYFIILTQLIIWYLNTENSVFLLSSTPLPTSIPLFPSHFPPSKAKYGIKWHELFPGNILSFSALQTLPWLR